MRLVVGKSGAVPMRSEVAFRFGYGRTVPWVQHVDGGVQAVAGPELVRFLAPVEMRGENFRTVAEFVIRPGDRLPFVLAWSPSHVSQLPGSDPERALLECGAFGRRGRRGATSRANPLTLSNGRF
jgi:hypothetical protein